MSSLDKLPSLRSKGLGGRNDKLGLWSAVALQQHFVLSTSPQSGAIDLNVLPQSQPHGRLTLAQKMGLVPLPPPEPSTEDWKQIETRAALRTEVKKIDETRCSICLEPFYQTMNQAQVILNCSHVFHELCFKQFEKLTRRQQRSEGEYPTNMLACPECRRTHYHKRYFYVGKALAQRSAIVKIQSAVRGFLTRKHYIRLRIRSDKNFRDFYVHQKLEKLSRAWEAYLEYREKERDRIMLSIDAKKQEAIAAYYTEEDWNNIIEKRITADKFALCERQLIHLSSSEAEDGEYNECPICLERIRRRVQLHCPKRFGGNAGTYGDEVVAGFRREYEEKKRQKEIQKKEKQNRTTKKRDYCLREQGPQQLKGINKRVNFSLKDSLATSGNQITPALIPPFCDETCYVVPTTHGHVERPNIILSCGHCFHESCVRTFEKYSQWRTNENGYSVINRCPVCRAGYASHAF